MKCASHGEQKVRVPKRPPSASFSTEHDILGKVTKTKHKWHKVVGGMELETTGLTVQVGNKQATRVLSMWAGWRDDVPT